MNRCFIVHARIIESGIEGILVPLSAIEAEQTAEQNANVDVMERWFEALSKASREREGAD